jgi:hypothetical protein
MTNCLRLGKKGQYHNYLAVIIFLFVFGFMTILSYLILSNFVTQLSTTGYYSPEMASAAGHFLGGLRIMDVIMVLIMVVLIIGIGITSYMVASPAVFFLITFLMAGFLGFISYFFNYLFATIVKEPMFSAIIAYFPITIMICTNLHWVMLACIIVGSITLYAKRDKGQYV